MMDTDSLLLAQVRVHIATHSGFYLLESLIFITILSGLTLCFDMVMRRYMVKRWKYAIHAIYLVWFIGGVFIITELNYVLFYFVARDKWIQLILERVT